MKHSVLAWRKSSFSTTGDNCVEVAAGSSTVAIRDSKARSFGSMMVAVDDWQALLKTLR